MQPVDDVALEILLNTEEDGVPAAIFIPDKGYVRLVELPEDRYVENKYEK